MTTSSTLYLAEIQPPKVTFSSLNSRLPGGPPLRAARGPPLLHQVLRERLRQQLRRVQQDHRHRLKGQSRSLDSNVVARGRLVLQSNVALRALSSDSSSKFLIIGGAIPL